MKSFGTQFLLLWLSTLGCLGAEPWPGIAFKEVRAYAWPITRTGEEVVAGDGRPVGGALNKGGTLLSKSQVERLLKAELRRTSPRPRAGCYVPHNAFVFFNEARQPVAYLEICFDCLGRRVFPDDADCDPDFIALGELCAELKLPFGRFKSLARFKQETAPILGMAEDAPPPK